jgi:hypothetical protein
MDNEYFSAPKEARRHDWKQALPLTRRARRLPGTLKKCFGRRFVARFLFVELDSTFLKAGWFSPPLR